MKTLPTDPDLFFRGRPGDVRFGEIVEPLEQLTVYGHHFSPICLFGCPDDLGVTRNRGRAGAAKGPDAIRKAFYKMCPPMDLEWHADWKIVDLGNIAVGEDILSTHRNAREVATYISRSGGVVVLLGGGHDFAAPGVLGAIEGAKKIKSPGLINIDPHLDVREREKDLPHSGTPFREILESKRLRGQNFIQFGARANRNAKTHYDYCIENGVQIHSYDQIRRARKHSVELFGHVLNRLAKKTDWIAITIDMDSCCDCEGTSAAPTIGFSADELYGFAQLAGANPLVRYLEIAEVAPTLDREDRSARIGAELLFAFFEARARSLAISGGKRRSRPASQKRK